MLEANINENLTDKYRPRKFSDMVGQHSGVARITAAIEHSALPPAYLLSGIHGGGKTTSAGLIALSLNCTNRVGVEPCGKCSSCVSIINSASDYVLEVDGARVGKVEDMRNLIASLSYVVPDGSYKVIIIDECHRLSGAAWDATLKIIEKPPHNVMFIFVTNELQKVKSTIKSRCVHVQFPGVNDDVVISQIEKVCTLEKVEIEKDACIEIAKNSHGSLRTGLSILEGFIRTGKVTAEQVREVYQTIDPNTILAYFNNVVAKDLKSASNMTKGWMRLGIGPDIMLTNLLDHLRYMIMDFKITDNTLKTMMKTQCTKIGHARVTEWIMFFYDQLKFIREYPMEYSLTIDLITIKLVDTLNTKVKTVKKVAKKETVTEKKVEPVAIKPIDTNKVTELQRVCGGNLIGADKKFMAVTIQNNKGTVFDIVKDVSFVKSPYYLLEQDLEAVIQDYPNSMNTYIKTK